MNAKDALPLERDPASWRDRAGYVFRQGGRVFRAVSVDAADDFDAFVQSPLSARLLESGSLAPFRVVPRDERAAFGELADDPRIAQVVEHEPHAPWTYPYEWHFHALKDAAMLHLTLQLQALEHGFVLSDASAYNLQFTARGPQFMDLLSFRRYRDGEYWSAHRQFCDQFLCPLLLETRFGLGWQAWFRGALDGVPMTDLAALCGWREWLSPRWAMHVMLPARLGKRRPSASIEGRDQASAPLRPLPRAAYRSLLDGLRGWIGALAPAARRTQWDDYAEHNTYADSERAAKRDFVAAFVGKHRPQRLLDLGCNTGDFADAALRAGAASVVGFDSDAGALARAWQRRKAGTSGAGSFLPLYLDAANPSPAQGWAESERSAFSTRFGADALIALAFVHHLAIARNVPLGAVLRWLVALAPCGVIEFVPPDDPTVIRMLRFRGATPHEYSQVAFERELGALARITARQPVTGSGRVLYAYADGTP